MPSTRWPSCSDVRYGLAEQRVAARATVLATAYAAHPERFPRGLPQPPARPMEVWINPPRLSLLGPELEGNRLWGCIRR